MGYEKGGFELEVGCIKGYHHSSPTERTMPQTLLSVGFILQMCVWHNRTIGQQC